jgi:hypothetical protein
MNTIKEEETKRRLNHAPPPCLKSGVQCRDCFGWNNMMKATHDIDVWRNQALRCGCTGLTSKSLDEERDVPYKDK